MSRVKISEFKAKELIYGALGMSYSGISINGSHSLDFAKLSADKRYVLKVDQGVKKRNKLGLILVDITKSQIAKGIKLLLSKGYDSFLIEEFVPHSPQDEKFLALERTRNGIRCLYTTMGGVAIEENKENVKDVILNSDNSADVAQELGLKEVTLNALLNAFESLYLSFFESNPFLIQNKKMVMLDLAVEVDGTADFFVNGKWTTDDFIENQGFKTTEEVNIANLADRSSASFKLVVLNPKGSIFTIFSGGGASIVLADEIDNIGHGADLADYAEYSGGPTEDETYIFTKNILSLALASPAKNKKIYIAGGVANFTDIRATFKGVIRALDEKKIMLKKQGIKIYVRRGGPYQEEGLSLMKNFLQNAGLLGSVLGPDRVITEIVTLN